jgi:hypothetical protein
MPITEEIFQAFLRCETKSYLKLSSEVEISRGLSDWQRRVFEECRDKCAAKLCADLRGSGCVTGVPLLQSLADDKCRLLINCVTQSAEIKSTIHALERLASSSKVKHNPFVPIRFVPGEKVTRHDKLSLAFDALALSLATGKMPLFGKIIHGGELRVVKIKLGGLMKTVRGAVRQIAAQQASDAPSVDPEQALRRM